MKCNQRGAFPLQFYGNWVPAGGITALFLHLPTGWKGSIREEGNMHYLILATDYDGTLALHGRVDEPTLAALERFLASGRKLVLVTGRELPELQTVFPHLDLFEWVVAENGALLYRPATRE